MTEAEWGTKQWQEDHFPKGQLDSDGDTWGMRWHGLDKLRHHSYLKLIGPDLREAQSLKVLDIGCALCDFTKKAWNLDTENQFWCMDISENAIAWDKANFPEFTFKSGAIPDIPFDVKFDVIFCLEVLAYLKPQDREKTVENIQLKLAPSGKLVFAGVLHHQHHSETEVTDLIGKYLEVRELSLNHWTMYRKLIEGPLEKVLSIVGVLLRVLEMPDNEYQEWISGGNDGPKIRVANFLRLTKPVSIWVLRGISSLSKSIIGSRYLALTCHWLSKRLLSAGNADEIVIVAAKK